VFIAEVGSIRVWVVLGGLLVRMSQTPKAPAVDHKDTVEFGNQLLEFLVVQVQIPRFLEKGGAAAVGSEAK
jgi:hypothetical protein